MSTLQKKTRRKKGEPAPAKKPIPQASIKLLEGKHIAILRVPLLETPRGSRNGGSNITICSDSTTFAPDRIKKINGRYYGYQVSIYELPDSDRGVALLKQQEELERLKKLSPAPIPTIQESPLGKAVLTV
jgi:hypothetical protein